MNRFLLSLGLITALSLSAAHAQEGNATLPASAPKAPEISTERLAYEVSGRDSQRGAYTERVVIQRHSTGAIEVARATVYGAQGRRHVQRGFGTAKGRLIRVTLEDLLGADDKLQPGAVAGPPTRFSVQIKADGSLATQGWSKAGNSTGSGVSKGPAFQPQPTAPEKANSPDKDDDPSLKDKIVQKGKHLLAVAEEEIKKRIKKEGKKLAYDGVKLEQDFKLSKFFHIGVGGRVHVVETLSRDQVLTSKRFPKHVWIRSIVHGGVRVPLNTSIPVGQVTISLGLNSAARVDYEVTDLYPIPAGVTDIKTVVADLKRVGMRSFDLPLDATEAKAMTVGATRVFDGYGSVAVSGALSIGHEVASVKGVVKIGASARVGGFYRIRGDVRIAVDRLDLDRARVRLTRGTTKTMGGSAGIFLGATFDDAKLREEIAPGVEYIDEALIDLKKLPASLRKKIVDEAEGKVVDEIKDTVRKLVRFELSASLTKTHEDELDLSFQFDLNNPVSRQAYERAVRGDFTVAEKKSLDPDSGVYREHRVVEIEDLTHRSAKLHLSVFLNADANKTISVKDLSVEDESGHKQYEIFRFKRNYGYKFFKRERRKSLDVEVIRRMNVDAELPASTVKRSLRFRLDVLDPSTFKGEADELQRLMKAWALDDGSGLDTPEFEFLRSRYRKTRTKVDVAISEEGIQQALAMGGPAILDAYARAFTTIKGEQPLWATASGRQQIANSEHDDNDNHRNERMELGRAKQFVKYLRELGAAKNAKQRAKAMKRLANTSRYDLYVVAALVELAPKNTVTLDASMLGKRIRVADGRKGQAFNVPVVDPR
jgi:hypothetical protein